MGGLRVCFYGNWATSYTSESHHAASLEELGCTVVRLQEPQCTAEQILREASRSDCFVWVATHGWVTPRIEDVLRELKRQGIPTLAYHLDAFIQIPDRWERYKKHPSMTMLDYYFTVDQCLADWLNENTGVQGHYLPPGVFGPECYVAQPSVSPPFEVCFVGSYGYHSSYPMRPKLISWLQSTYGDRFAHYGGDGLGVVRGAALNQVYADAKVVVGDSYITDPNYPGKYWSDRVPESLGRGAFLAAPWVYGLDEQFVDHEHLVMYKHGDFDQLKDIVDYWLDDSHAGERERIRKSGHEHAKATATYRHRWQEILDIVCTA